jgi:hypothetical protein
LGSIQGDGIRKISGHFPAFILQNSFIYTYIDGAFNLDSILSRGIPGTSSAQETVISSFDTSRHAPTSNEIRPANVAVRLMMRSLP